MKKIFFLLILFSLQCTAQSNIVPLTECNKIYNHADGSAYFKDTNNEMDKYVGTWKWAQGNKEFILTLIKQIKHHYHQTGNDNYYEDRLIGYYQVKENGNIIADTAADNLSNDFGAKVMFTLICDNIIQSISFNDYLKGGVKFDAILEKLSPTQMKFKAKLSADAYTEPNPGEIVYYGTGSTFPLDVVLTKQ